MALNLLLGTYNKVGIRALKTNIEFANALETLYKTS